MLKAKQIPESLRKMLGNLPGAPSYMLTYLTAGGDVPRTTVLHVLINLPEGKLGAVVVKFFLAFTTLGRPQLGRVELSYEAFVAVLSNHGISNLNQLESEEQSMSVARTMGRIARVHSGSEEFSTKKPLLALQTAQSSPINMENKTNELGQMCLLTAITHASNLAKQESASGQKVGQTGAPEPKPRTFRKPTKPSMTAEEFYESVGEVNPKIGPYTDNIFDDDDEYLDPLDPFWGSDAADKVSQADLADGFEVHYDAEGNASVHPVTPAVSGEANS